MSTQSTGLRTAGKTKLLLATVVAAGAALALSSTSAKASVIYQEAFGGTSTATIVGTSPTTDPSGAKWQANDSKDTAATYRVDGSASNTSSGGDYLTFAPTSGNLYTLSATLTPTDATSGWLSLDFSTGIPTAATGPGMIVTSTQGSTTGYGIQLFTTGSSHPSNVTIPSTVTPGETAEITLNTTGADWVATWYYGGSELATYTYTTNPTVAGVSIGFLGANEGSVGNFVLATATPEPASIGLFGLGAVGLLLARRKRA